MAENGRPYTISSPTKQTTSTDDLISISARFKPFKKPVYYKRATIFLSIFILFLLAACIILIVLYTKLRQPSVCVSNECIRSAANLKFSMNFSANPCDNFYEYCCGKWSQEHPNHGWYSSFSTFTTISEKIAIESMAMLKEKVNDDEPVAVGQAKILYKSCMALDDMEELGLTPIYEYLDMAYLPRTPNFFNSTLDSYEFDWVQSEVLLKTILAMDIFIGFTVQPNIFKRNENALYLGVLFQSCPLPSPLKPSSIKGIRASKDDEDEEMMEELKIIRSEIFELITKAIMENSSYGIVDNAKLKIAKDIIDNMTDFMDDLTENYTLPEGDGGEDSAIQLTIMELQNLTDHNVDESLPNFWINYINQLFDSTNVSIDPENDKIITSDLDLEYLWEVLNHITKQPPVNIELYMWWSAVYAMIANTVSEVSFLLSEMNTYYTTTSGNPLFVRSRSLDCCELVNKYMGWAVSYGLADRNFPEKTKPKVDRMIEQLKISFMEQVKELKWMDWKTKRMTLEKSEETLSLIGYPEWLFKEGALDRKYAGVEINETTYLSNMVNIIRKYTKDTLTSLRLTNARDWSTEAITVNAFNSFSDNAINIPMAILTYPLYELGLEVLNYGSIGSILGHELTHGFDDGGRKYDKYGNYRRWWSNHTTNTFENMTKCFINQYENYTINGVSGHVKGLATLSENLADNGGLNQAYQAYKRHKSKYGEDQKLPGFEDYSNDQLFFIAYGSIWCETSNMKSLKYQLEHDEHSPNEVRVRGTLQNSEDFARAFKCPKDSKMNSMKRCKIW